MPFFDVNYIATVLLIFSMKYWICRHEYNELLSELKKKIEIIEALNKETRSVEYLYGILTLLGLVEKADHEIKCLSAALEFIPKYYKYIQRAMKVAEDFHMKLDDALKKFESRFGDQPLFDQCAGGKDIDMEESLQLANKAPSHYCLLENFFSQSPIEDTFSWNECTSGQWKKLEKDYSKLKQLYSDVPDAQLRRTIAYAYNYFKKNIFILRSVKLRKIVGMMINGDQDLGDFEDEVDLCIICLDEIDDDESCATLKCNHFFHSLCIRGWLKEHDICPICRQQHDRNITF